MNKSDYILVAVIALIGYAIYVTGTGWPLLALGLVSYKS